MPGVFFSGDSIKPILVRHHHHHPVDAVDSHAQPTTIPTWTTGPRRWTTGVLSGRDRRIGVELRGRPRTDHGWPQVRRPAGPPVFPHWDVVVHGNRGLVHRNRRGSNR